MRAMYTKIRYLSLCAACEELLRRLNRITSHLFPEKEHTAYSKKMALSERARIRIAQLAGLCAILTASCAGFAQTADIEVLHPQLTLREGETTTLALFKTLSGQTGPVTVTLAIGESGKRFLSLSSTQIAISEEEGGTAAVTVTARDNEDFADIQPVNIALSATGGNARLTPAAAITVTIENNDVYTIGFDRGVITLEEGMSETVRLSIDPQPQGAAMVTVALPVSDNEQIAVNPERVIFSAASSAFNVVVTAVEDAIPELKDTFTVSIAPPAGIAAEIGEELSVIVPVDNSDILHAIVERAVIPEGAAASVFVDADISQSLTINLNVSGPMGAQADVSLSRPSLTLSPSDPSALFTVSVADNGEAQADSGTFTVELSTEFTPQPELPSLTFTVPPNDLTAHAAMTAEFKIGQTEQTIAINTTPTLRDGKSFFVLSEDPRLIVKTGLITPAKSPFSVELALSEGVVFGREERLSLSIVHLDSWRQRSAQAQLGVGGFFNCGIKADETMACWGLGTSNRINPTSSLQGVNANTRFLAVSSGDFHSCAIKADETMACWGSSAISRINPTSSPQGVNANTRFLAVSAGESHTCGIKTDSAVACWGDGGFIRPDPTRNPQGVNANTRFLAIDAGDNHTCAIKADSALACWGSATNNRLDPTSAAGVNANTRFLAASAGNSHTCAIKADSAVACWGDPSVMKTSPTSSPQGVDADTRFLAVSAGHSHTCAIKADGEAVCWGNGANTCTDPARAAAVNVNARFLAVAAGWCHSCGIKADGAIACWGTGGQGQASPPSGSFNRTPDTLRLAESATPLTTEGGGQPAQLNEVTEVEPLHSQLTLREGETTTLALFRVLSGPANPITITLTIEESGKQFLSLRSTQLTINEEGGTATATITAIDNEDVADMDPVSIALSLAGDNARLTTIAAITVTIEDNDVYIIGFEEGEITLREGMSATARLSISPAISGVGTVTVTAALSVSDTRQLTVDPEEVVFSAANSGFDIAVTVIEDAIPESEETFTVSLTLSADVPTMIGAELSVIVPADDDTIMVRVFPERTVIPEGMTASVLLDADINQDLTVNLAASGLMSTQTNVSLSASSLTLTPDNPSTLFNISVADNSEPQKDNRTFNVDLNTELIPQSELPPLTFTIPPNDLTARAAMRAEFTLENKRDTQTITIGITPPLQDDKSFLVFSEDPRLIVKTGLITSDRPSFPIELALNESVILGREERLSLSIVHLDSWQPFAQPTAQAQLSAGAEHTCGIKADGAAACWGSDGSDRDDPTSAAGVDANTRFLALSAGRAHNCGIKADSAMVCWGFDGSDRADPTSADGVNANTRFLAVSVGDVHACGIKADSGVACWGGGGSDRADPTSSMQGVNANTRFLAVSVHYGHNCGIKADSAVTCWGDPAFMKTDPTSADGVDANTRFLAVSSGDVHTCGIKADGTAACWGFDTDDRLDPTSSPQGVDADTRFLALSAGVAHTCGIKADNTVACWGVSGNDRTDPTSSPQGVNANTGFLAVSAGGSHSCGIKADGAVACWGNDGDGQASPPSDSFARTPDVIRLAESATPLMTEGGGQPAQLNEVTEVELLHSSAHAQGKRDHHPGVVQGVERPGKPHHHHPDDRGVRQTIP